MISNSGTSTLGLYDLKRQIDAFGGVDYFRPNLAGGYLKNARVMLANGDIVKSTIDGNTNDPNVDMTGWVKPNAASQIFDESGLNQQELNNGVESIEDLLAISNPKNGSRVYVKGYRPATNLALAKPYIGGGVFIYDESKSTLNDGVINFNGWVRQFEIITSSMAGCYIDGEADDRENLQRGVNVTAALGIPLYLDDGVHLMASATFERWGTLYETRCYIIDNVSNMHIIGLSQASVIKYADGVCYTGYDEAGYKGAQLFCSNPLINVSNIRIHNVFFDGNGYNNKQKPLNWAGNTAGNQAIVLHDGEDAKITSCTFKNFSGYQVIYSRYGFQNVEVSGNTFIDAGWLDGTNWQPDYTDQSTVFLSGTYTLFNNSFIQNYAGMFAGTAFELHGKGYITGNRIIQYANAVLSVGMYFDADNVFQNNYVFNCNTLACTDVNFGFKCKLSILNNFFYQNTMNISEATEYGRFRCMVYALGYSSPSTHEVIIKGNTLISDGVYADRSNESLALYSTICYSQMTNIFVLDDNVIRNVKGSLFRLGVQANGSSVRSTNNKFYNCGIPTSTHFGNAIMYADNRGEVSYGVKLGKFVSANNVYEGCTWGRYLTTLVTADGLMLPDVFESNNEVFIASTLIKTLGTPIAVDAKQSTSFLFNIKSINTTSSTIVIDDNTGDAFKSYNQWGEYTIQKDKQHPVVYRKNGTTQDWSVVT